MAKQSDEITITPEEYGEFIKGIELKDVYLSSSKIKRLREPDLDALLRYGPKRGKSKYGKSGDGFYGTFNFHVDLLEEGDETPFGEINVTFVVSYVSEKRMTQKIFDIFQDYNLPLNAFPYVREYIHTTTHRMGMPALILPTMKNT